MPPRDGGSDRPASQLGPEGTFSGQDHHPAGGSGHRHRTVLVHGAVVAEQVAGVVALGRRGGATGLLGRPGELAALVAG